jgi:hypothetical protein
MRQIHRYVDLIDFEQDEVFGIFNRRLELIALAHLAHRDADPSRGTAAACRSSASRCWPRRAGAGFGRRLFDHAMLHARNRGVQTIFIHALSENTTMLKLAKDAGAIVERARIGIGGLAAAAARLVRLAPRRGDRRARSGVRLSMEAARTSPEPAARTALKPRGSRRQPVADRHRRACRCAGRRCWLRARRPPCGPLVTAVGPASGPPPAVERGMPRRRRHR